VVAALCVALGRWQLGRAEEKRAFFAAYDRALARPVRTAPVEDAAAVFLRFQPIRLQGHYDGAHQVLLDEKVQDGKTGYHVLTPFIVEGGPAVLVNRGWVPAGMDRRKLPDVPVDGSERTVNGRLSLLPRPAMQSGPSATEVGWPRRLLYPTVDEIAGAMGYRVHAWQVLLAPDEPDGYLRDWRPQVMKPEQHVAYAFQWFALGAALVVIYVVVNLKRRPRA
jgi:surfeit locus 1 family protein